VRVGPTSWSWTPLSASCGFVANATPSLKPTTTSTPSAKRTLTSAGLDRWLSSRIEVDGEEWTPEPGASDETLAIPFRANGTSTDVHVAFKLGEDEVAVSIDKNLGEARVLSAAQEAE
jgi:hypothetical protein